MDADVNEARDAAHSDTAATLGLGYQAQRDDDDVGTEAPGDPASANEALLSDRFGIDNDLASRYPLGQKMLSRSRLGAIVQPDAMPAAAARLPGGRGIGSELPPITKSQARKKQEIAKKKDNPNLIPLGQKSRLAGYDGQLGNDHLPSNEYESEDDDDVVFIIENPENQPDPVVGTIAERAFKERASKRRRQKRQLREMQLERCEDEGFLQVSLDLTPNEREEEAALAALAQADKKTKKPHSNRHRKPELYIQKGCLPPYADSKAMGLHEIDRGSRRRGRKEEKPLQRYKTEGRLPPVADLATMDDNDRGEQTAAIPVSKANKKARERQKMIENRAKHLQHYKDAGRLPQDADLHAMAVYEVDHANPQNMAQARKEESLRQLQQNLQRLKDEGHLPPDADLQAMEVFKRERRRNNKKAKNEERQARERIERLQHHIEEGRLPPEADFGDMDDYETEQARIAAEAKRERKDIKRELEWLARAGQTEPHEFEQDLLGGLEEAIHDSAWKWAQDPKSAEAA
jgi:hypothetical protein